jgi:hypothetical protein
MNCFVDQVFAEFLTSPTRRKKCQTPQYALEIYTCTILIKEIHFIFYNFTTDQNVLEQALLGTNQIKTIVLENVKNIETIRCLAGLNDPRFPLLSDWVVTQNHNATFGKIKCFVRIIHGEEKQNECSMILSVNTCWYFCELHHAILESKEWNDSEFSKQQYEIVEFMSGGGGVGGEGETNECFGIDGKLSDFRHSAALCMGIAIDAVVAHPFVMEPLL